MKAFVTSLLGLTLLFGVGRASASTVSLLTPTTGQSFQAPADILLVALVEDPVGSAMAAKVEFFANDKSLGSGQLHDPGPPHVAIFQFYWTNVPSGEYSLTARVTDAQGATAASAPVKIRVNPVLTPPVVTIRATDAEASESGNPGQFTVSRTGPTNTALTVFCAFSGTASNGVDYSVISSLVVISAGAESVHLTVKPVNDELVEGPETVVATLGYGGPLLGFPISVYTIGTPSNAVVTIADNDPWPPVVTIRATDPQASESGSTGQFTVSRTGSTNEGLTVFYAISGTASNGVDYLNLPGNVVIPAGSLSAPINVSPVQDNLLEGSESVILTLQYPPTASPLPSPYSIGTPGNAYVTIADDDPFVPTIVTIRATDDHATEPGVLAVIDPGVVTITRSGDTNSPLLVYLSIGGTAGNGVDYTSISNSFTIPAGQTSSTILINPLADSLTEGTETVVLRLQEPICPAIFPPPPGCYSVGLLREAVVSIADGADSTNHAPRVQLIAPANGQWFVTPASIALIAHAQDADGDSTVQTVEFFEGTNSLGITTNLPVLNPLGPYFLTWSNVPSGIYKLRARATDDHGATAFSEPVAIAVLATNRPPETNLPPLVTIFARDPVAAEGTNTATFVVRRSGPTNASLTVLYGVGGSASNGVDYAAISGSVAIPAGESSAPITITPIEDTLPEPPETVALRLMPPASAPATYRLGWPRTATALLRDNDRSAPGLGVLGDHTFHLSLPAANGFKYRLECSIDMLHWVPVLTNTATADGIQYSDAEAQEFSSRFYRIVAADQ